MVVLAPKDKDDDAGDGDDDADDDDGHGDWDDVDGGVRLVSVERHGESVGAGADVVKFIFYFVADDETK